MSTTLKRTGTVLFAAGLTMAAPMAAAQAQSSVPDVTGSSESPAPDMQQLPQWAFEALHYGPMKAGEVQACWDEQGDVIIQIYPGPCPNEPISQVEYHAANVLWFFTSHTGNLS